MKQILSDIYCIYTEARKRFVELLEDSFRLYLVRDLAMPKKRIVQCLRYVVACFKEKAMYLEISNPIDYHVTLYICLLMEDEIERFSQSVTNQKFFLTSSFISIGYPSMIPISMMVEWHQLCRQYVF